MYGRSPLPALVLALALALALGACGSSSGSDPGSSSDPGSGGSGGSGGGPAGADEAALAFAECMRDEGVEDFPDPEVSDDGRVRITGGGDPDDPTVQAAQEACQPLLEEGGSFAPPDPEAAAAMEEQVLAFAECMREQGIDFPDPEVDGGRVMMRPGAGVDPESPEFADAQEACEDELPDGGPGGPGGPGGAGAPGGQP